MKAIVRRILNRVGYDVIRLKNSNTTLSSNLMNIIRNKNIGCVIDVGANSGQYGLLLRQIGYVGRILSFEPVRDVFNKLESVAKHDAKWNCFHCALGAHEEEREINVYESTDFSSFLDANEYSKATWNSLRESHAETVQVRRLDIIYPALMKDMRNVRCLLKMDTQGYDMNVFEGARGVLANVDALQSEISIINIYESMPDGLDTLKLFREHGYYISGMYSINREDSLAAIEVDCLLVRRSGRHEAAKVIDR